MSLKLVEAGVPKEKLGLMSVPLIPLQIALPLIISKYSTGILLQKAKTNQLILNITYIC